MTTKFVGSAAVAVLLLGSGLASENSTDTARLNVLNTCDVPETANGWRTEVFPMPRAVRGFPMIVGIRLTNTTDYRRSVRILDLASAGADRALTFFIEEESVGCRRFSRSSSDGLVPPSVFSSKHPSDNVWIESGDSISMWFDVAHVMSYPPGLQVWPTEREAGIPGVFFPGDWEMLIRDEQLSVNWGPFRVTYRNPTSDERLFLDRLGLPEDSSWFPAVVIREDRLPDSADLPGETRTIVDLARVLRAAAKLDEDESAKNLRNDALSTSWMQGLFVQLEYEVFVSHGQPHSALEFSEELDRGNVALVGNGAGLLESYRELCRKERD